MEARLVFQTPQELPLATVPLMFTLLAQQYHLLFLLIFPRQA